MANTAFSEFVAKHEGMKKAKTTLQFMPETNALLEAPAFLKSAGEVIQPLKQALDNVECPPGYKLTQKHFGQLMGAPRSTIHDWYHGELAAPIKCFLCGLERLPELQRMELLRARDCPRLQHPRLAHDAAAVASLSELVVQPSGLTFVVGADDVLRTFVVTAIGNSVTQLIPNRVVCGFDAHRPDEFVPVPGVLYFNHPTDLTQVKRLVRTLWKQLEDSPAELILLNGVWVVLPEIRARIVEMANRRVVIVADEFDSAPRGPSGERGFQFNVVIAGSEPNGSKITLHRDTGHFSR